MLVRQAQPADMSVLRDIYRRSSLSNEEDRVHLLANPDALEFSSVAVDQGRTRVVVVDARIVGFATTIDGLDFIELEDLFVDPDWMRRGVGRELVLHVAASARERGIRHVEVTAGRDALGFYGRTGFIVVHDVETRFGPALRMRLDVAP